MGFVLAVKARTKRGAPSVISETPMLKLSASGKAAIVAAFSSRIAASSRSRGVSAGTGKADTAAAPVAVMIPTPAIARSAVLRVGALMMHALPIASVRFSEANRGFQTGALRIGGGIAIRAKVQRFPWFPLYGWGAPKVGLR